MLPIEILANSVTVLGACASYIIRSGSRQAFETRLGGCTIEILANSVTVLGACASYIIRSGNRQAFETCLGCCPSKFWRIPLRS